MSPVNVAVGLQDAEAAIDGIAAIIMSREFFNVLEDVWANRGTFIPLRAPEVVYTEEAETPAGYPCCELLLIGSTKDRDSPQIQHEVSAQWTVNGDQPEVMGREVKRYIEATRRHFDGLSLLPYVGASPVSVGNADFSPVTGVRGNNDFLKSGAISLFFEMTVR